MVSQKKYKLLVNAGSLFSGGTLSIAKELLYDFAKSDQFIIYAVVHKRSFYNVKNIKYIVIPWIKNTLLHRIFFELIFINYIIFKNKIELLFNCHDISSLIFKKSCKQFVYCHNPCPFHNVSYYDFKFNKKFFLFCLFYKYVYQFNINSNSIIFVQQNYIKKYFIKNYGNLNIQLHRPSSNSIHNSTRSKFVFSSSKTYCIFPSIARTFKNHLFLINIFKELDTIKDSNVILLLTIQNITPFEKFLQSHFSQTKNIINIGYVKQTELYYFYENVDFLIFPSLLETWGLPLTEAIKFDLPILCSDLSYARETVGNYDKCMFLDPSDGKSWIDVLHSLDFRYNSQTNKSLANYHSDLSLPISSIL